MPSNAKKIIIDIHFPQFKFTSLILKDNLEKEISYSVKRIIPRFWRYQRSELETLMDGSAKEDLWISTSVARWLLRDFLKNPSFVFSALKSTYRLILDLHEDLVFPVHISTGKNSDEIWISRNSVKSGVAPVTLDESLEYDRLRNPKRFSLLVLFVKNSRQVATHDLFEPTQFGLLSPKVTEQETYLTDYEILEHVRVIHGKLAVQNDKIIQISNQRFELIPRSPAWVESKDDWFQIFRPHTNAGEIDQAIFFGSNLNLFHFIVESVTRFVAIPHDLTQGTPIILESSVHTNIRQLCELLTSVPPIILKPGEEIAVRKLIVGIESGVVDPIDPIPRAMELISIRNRVLKMQPRVDREPKLRVYLRRPSRLFRPLQNEKRIVRLLSRHGFISVYPEKVCINNLIQLLASAEFVVVESGAAITNLMFAGEDVKVLELHPGTAGIDFWGRFLDIFGIQNMTIVGKKQIIGFKGLAIDGYRVKVKEIEKRLQEFGMRVLIPILLISGETMGLFAEY
jgi:hypothetical protein